MMNHRFQLAAALDVAGATRLTEALRATAGVSDVGAQAGNDRIEVAFDSGTTSTQELAQVVSRTGHAIRQPKPHGTGSCCGGCGGG